MAVPSFVPTPTGRTLTRRPHGLGRAAIHTMRLAGQYLCYIWETVRVLVCGRASHTATTSSQLSQGFLPWSDGGDGPEQLHAVSRDSRETVAELV